VDLTCGLVFCSVVSGIENVVGPTADLAFVGGGSTNVLEGNAIAGAIVGGTFQRTICVTL
jgi:hypothetical protein